MIATPLAVPRSYYGSGGAHGSLLRCWQYQVYAENVCLQAFR